MKPGTPEYLTKQIKLVMKDMRVDVEKARLKALTRLIRVGVHLADKADIVNLKRTIKELEENKPLEMPTKRSARKWGL